MFPPLSPPLSSPPSSSDPSVLRFEDAWRPTHRVVLYQADTKAVHALTVMQHASGLAFTRHDWLSQGQPLLIVSPDGSWVLDENARQEHGPRVRLLKVEPLVAAQALHQARAA